MSYKQHQALAPPRHLQKVVTLKSHRLDLMVHNRTGLHGQLLGMEGSGQSCNVSRPGVMAEAFHHSSQLCPVEAVPIPCRHTQHGGDCQQSKFYGMT